MSTVLPLSIVLRPGSNDDPDALVRAADLVARDLDRVEFGSHRKGLELRCVWFNDVDEVIARLAEHLTSDVRIVERSVRMLHEPDLMEPVMRIEIHSPRMVAPVIMALIDDLRGRNVAQSERGDHVALVAEAPLHEILDLPSRLRSLSDGEARVAVVTFSHHQQV